MDHHNNTRRNKNKTTIPLPPPPPRLLLGGSSFNALELENLNGGPASNFRTCSVWGRGEGRGRGARERERAGGAANAANNGRLVSDTGYQFFSPNLKPARRLALACAAASAPPPPHALLRVVAQPAATQQQPNRLSCLKKEKFNARAQLTHCRR